MNPKRFINLNLLTLQYPFTAIISILHRLSGLLVFLLIPFLLCFCSKALSSEAGFTAVAASLNHPLSRVVLWFFLAGLGYHFAAGVRHLIMDMGWGESLTSARRSGEIVLVISLIWASLMGVWLW